MTDSHIKRGSGHSRSASISKTSSHQRKPSSHYQFNAQATHSSNLLDPPPPHSTPASKWSYHPSAWRRYSQKILLHLDPLLFPAGSLLPRDRQSVAFGGTQRRRHRLLNFAQLRWVRFLALFYCVFSVFLSFNHIWAWLVSLSPSYNLDPRFGPHWVPQRTYDQDEPYSILSNMTHDLRMSKLFSKSHYASTRHVQPYWLKATTVPDPDDVSVITFATPDTWPQLERLIEHWKGPISVTLRAEKGSEKLGDIQAAYHANPKLRDQVDVHLTQMPIHGSVLLSRNAERNLARLFSRTEFVLELPFNVVLATDLRRTLEINKKLFTKTLRSGDLLVLPMFAFPNQEKGTYTLPYTKSRLLELVDSGELAMLDPHWNMNEGPTHLKKWRDAETLYVVEQYDPHYEAIVIESKIVQPWCSERFQDSRSACLLASYLSGAEFLVLPDDFSVQLPGHSSMTLSDFDKVIESRLYSKFHWEQCVHQARQLDGLGLGPDQSQHIRTQCAIVLQNWGQGLVEK